MKNIGVTDYDTKMGRLNTAVAAAGCTGEQRNSAYYLYDDLLDVAAQHGMGLVDLEAAGLDLPTACVRMVLAKESDR
ncbi:hypothetical protein [Streptomyces pinistramenti]|uniref:hypothetical protein n=1 Tax=Streptomyces pinistramenti TaxID=2884812 RepID=UPI001D0994D5|nr:hypothetical protein [Streptomyces pinistramenti]MCB5910403.1 hypothetical protein [Streptomyces pinistramenti]